MVGMVKRLLPIVLAAAMLPMMLLGAPGPQAPASAVPIKHVVVLYLENHSFDNVLGYWCDQTLPVPPGCRRRSPSRAARW